MDNDLNGNRYFNDRNSRTETFDRPKYEEKCLEEMEFTEPHDRGVMAISGIFFWI